ncbi:MAG: exonuclease domain-containing protein [Candidatus Zixiibacteriota bacterium]
MTTDGLLPLSEHPIAVVDVETTGLSPRNGDRVCEIAVIRRNPDGTLRRFVSFVDPQRRISAGAFAVNGITPDMLHGAPLFCAVRSELDAILSDAMFVAHNAPFDLGFVQHEFALCGCDFTTIGVIDTRLLSRRFLRLSSHSLASVARHFGISQPSAHRALADCETTLRVLDAIVDQANLASVPVSELMNVTVSVGPPVAVPTPALPDGLADLIRRDGEVEITYLTARGSRSRRSIRDIQVFRMGEHVYLTGFCSLRQAERQFRLDRILAWKSANSASDSWQDFSVNTHHD